MRKIITFIDKCSDCCYLEIDGHDKYYCNLSDEYLKKESLIEKEIPEWCQLPE